MMTKHDIWDAICYTMGSMMKIPDGNRNDNDALKPLFDLWGMAFAEGEEQQLAKDRERARECGAHLVYGCPLFDAPTTVMDAKTGKITGVREHGDD